MSEDLRDLQLATEAVSAIVSPVWAVGGCVRDSLLGRPVNDWDFTTPQLPDAIERAARDAGRHPYLAGKRFGTVGFKLPPETMRALAGADGELDADAPQPKALYVEVTTFRSETYEPGSRKPEVEFGSSLEADLSRRDFTINAMAFDGREVADPFGGRDDLAAGIIRAVGDPAERLRDDPLRIMRAARFAAQLGFAIDPALADAMQLVHVELANVSHERWLIEMDKLLCSPAPDAGLEALLSCGALRLIVPELASLAIVGGRDAWERVLARVVAAPPTPDERWAALLADAGIACGATTPEEVAVVSLEIASRTGHGMRWPKARRQAVARLLQGE